MPQNKIIYGPGRIPKASEFAVGEIIINLDDSKVYSKNKQNVVFELGTTGSEAITLAFATASFHTGSYPDFTYTASVDNKHLIFSASTGIRFTEGDSPNSVVITATGESISVATIADTASYVESSNVDGPLGFDSVLSSSYSLTASYFDGEVANAISASYAVTASYVQSAATASFVEAANIGGDIDVSQLDLIFGYGLEFNVGTTQLDVAGNITGSNISSSGNLFASLSFASHDNVVVYDTSSGKLHYTSSNSVGGGNAVLQDDLTSYLPNSINVGGVFSGETFTAGTPLEEVLINILIEYAQATLDSLQVGVFDYEFQTFTTQMGVPSYKEIGNSSSVDYVRWISQSDSLGNYFDNTGYSYSLTNNQKDDGSSNNTISGVAATPYVGTLYVTNSFDSIYINRVSPGTVTFTVTGTPSYSGEGVYYPTITDSQPFLSPIFFGGSSTEINESNISDALLDTVLGNISGSAPAGSVGVRNISNQSQIDNTSTAFPSTLKIAMPDTVTASAAYTYIIYPDHFGDLTGISNGSQNEFNTFTKMGTADHTRYELNTTYKVYRSAGYRPFEPGILLTLND
jgi:hypothetical protein